MTPLTNSMAERYCAKYGIPGEKFMRHIRRKALYPHARFIVPVLVLFNGDYLAADNDFIEDVGQITTYGEFSASVVEFIYHPANDGFRRRILRLRVSTERMRKLVKQILPDPKVARSDDDQGTMSPHGIAAKDQDSGSPITS
ncbi:MAG: hypothetical protein K9M98_15265 [Cephaloticoccus sp.]|nr:hypothetical protein [Cephaloticoccus sp.]MCF7761859.1 hypothetical protein [Cephaloticoccus sp.]